MRVGRVENQVKHLLKKALLLCAIAALPGCASDPEPLQTTPYASVVDAPSLPLPASAVGAARIGPLDTIKIDVFGVEDLSQEMQVDSGGNISFPFVGSLYVTDKTASEVAQIIRAALADGYVRDPDVTVNLLSSPSQTFAIEGEIEKPGIYPAAGELSLLRALALAGGTTEFALKNEVIVFRTVDDQRYAGVYNLTAVRRGAYPDPRIYSGDIIVMGDSPRRRSIDRILTLAPAITSPLIILFTRL